MWENGWIEKGGLIQGWVDGREGLIEKGGLMGGWVDGRDGLMGGMV